MDADRTMAWWVSGGFLRDMEVSPFNPGARREPGGVWNEHQLPVLEWEIAERRVVLPVDLQIVLQLETSVLRWRRSKYEKVAREHAQQVEQRVLLDLDHHLDRWERAGPEPGKSETWRVFFRVEGRWVLVVIGRDREGSTNVVTLYSPSDNRYLVNMIAKGGYQIRARKR